MKKIFRIPTIICYLFTSLILLSSNSFSSPNNETLAQSTQMLVELNSMSNKHSNYKKTVEKIFPLIKNRQNQLISGLQSDPSAFIKFLLTDNETSSLPKEFSNYVEHEQSNIEGLLEIRAALYLKEHKEVMQYILKTDKGISYYINFYDVMNKPLKTGQYIRIKHAFELISENDVKQLFTSANDIIITRDSVKSTLSTVGEQKTFVFLVNFQDQPTNYPWSVNEVNEVVFNTINNMYQESSYNKTSVVGGVAGWYTVAINSTADCGTISGQIPSLAEAAATKAGVDFSSSTRRIYMFPYAPNCAWAGLGTVGGNQTTAWLNGYNSTSITGHELGHNLGLYHSKFLKCDGGPIKGNCTDIEYGDRADIMGTGGVAHFNTFQKDRLGWMNYQNTPLVQTITLSGNYNIDALETANTNIKAIRIPKLNATNDFYYLELRQGIGYDKDLDCTGCDYTKGILIHKGNITIPNSSQVLKMHPEFTNQNIMTLLPGESFNDPNSQYGGVTITLNSISASRANITAKFGGLPPTCERANPSMIINPVTTQWVSQGQGAGYGIALKNNDNQYCDSSTYLLTLTTPNGVTASVSRQTLTVAPGQQQTASVQVQTSTTTPAGLYAVVVNGINMNVPNNKASVNANLGVNAVCTQNNPTISLTPISQSGKRGTGLIYNFNVKNNDSSICGASTFAINAVIPTKFSITINPTTLSLTPGSNQSGKIMLASDRRAARGSYNFILKATNTTKTTMSNTVTGTYYVVTK